MTLRGARSRAERLQIWAYPLVFAQRLRLNFTQPLDPWGARPRTSAGAPANRLGHARALADPGLRVGVAPNVDTLYSVAWLDLEQGPFTLDLPSFGDRYASVQIALADSSTPVVVSRRTHPEGMPRIVLTRGERGIVSSGGDLAFSTGERWVMLVVRIGVVGEDGADVGRVHALQDALRLSGGESAAGHVTEADRRLAAIARREETLDPGAFAQATLQVLVDGDPSQVPADVQSVIDNLPLRELAAGSANSETLREVRLGLQDGLDAIGAHVKRLGRTANGWAVNERGTEFADDDLLRAAVAHAQIYVNPAAEAIYPVCEVDADGRALDGRRARYQVRFPVEDRPPADAFWSLTMYHAAGNLVANPLGRYAVGDRTPDLRREADGSLVIDISSSPPERGVANWLPAPDGPFRLMLRLYWPTRSDWSPPGVRRIERGDPR